MNKCANCFYGKQFLHVPDWYSPATPTWRVSCQLEPQTVEKAADDFCGSFSPATPVEISARVEEREQYETQRAESQRQQEERNARVVFVKGIVQAEIDRLIPHRDLLKRKRRHRR